jgi:hypothetical protein
VKFAAANYGIRFKAANQNFKACIKVRIPGRLLPNACSNCLFSTGGHDDPSPVQIE